MGNGKAKPWYAASFRRSLTDMHIPDWDERFLAQFDPGRYVDLLELAHVDTAMIYSSSCLGLCYWPTKLGRMHGGIKGRDILGEIIDGCHHKGMNVIVYYNFWSKWAYDEHPEWRVVSDKGEGTAEFLWDKGRYGVCCFNTPYRTFMLAQIADLCGRYEFEGMWIDMIFWPYTACYCWGCRKRYHEETGGDIPRTADWNDPTWVRFQRTRERWLAEFTADVTAEIKRRKPDVSVGHQCSAWMSGWKTGMSGGALRQSDYVSGDFYGDALQQSFTCKAFYHLTERLPFEFMTSRSPDLTDHTTTKPRELLLAQIYAAMANQGAFLFIDAVDPAGTLDERVYRMMGELYRETEVYEKYVRHDAVFCQDVAIYVNFESEAEPRPGEKTPMNAAVNAAKTLIGANIPFGVVTRKNLPELSRFQTVILPNVAVMDVEEVAAIKEYVHSGGSLYASKRTSTMTRDGVGTGDFQLADVFGVSLSGETAERVTYIAPSADAGGEFASCMPEYPAAMPGSQMLVTVAEGDAAAASVLATITLPYVNPDSGRFSSAISNPPGIATSWPAIVHNHYGQGRAVYAAGDLERAEFDSQRNMFADLIRSLRQKPYFFESDAPKCVEITMFHDEALRRFRIHLLNFQKELPNIPVDGIRIRAFIGERNPVRLCQAPDEQPLAYARASDGYVEFTAPRLETFALLVLDYEEA